jgi:amino acid adenylation domain-containing protein
MEGRVEMLNEIINDFELRHKNLAFVIDGVSYTYGELSKRVSAIQTCIDGRYPACGGRMIGVVDNADFDTYAAVLAVLACAHTYVPINPTTPVARNISILDQTGVDLLLNSKEPRNVNMSAALRGLQEIQTTTLQAGNDAPRPRAAAPDSLAYVLFTSGSTGTPKGVPISRRNLSAFLEGLLLIVDLGPNDRVLQMFDLTFDFSVMSLFAPLAVGACVYPASGGKHRFRSVYRLLEEQRITCAPMVPSVLNFLAPYFHEIRLDALRHSVFCGEPLLAKMAYQWSHCAERTQIFNFYGPTEATVFCSYYACPREHPKEINGALSIGKAMLHSTMFIVDEHGTLQPPNQPGELCVAGDQVAAGYWRDAQKTAASFFEVHINGSSFHAYRTGDSAYVDDDGDFMYIGRLDNQIKVQGFRVELAEIEYHARDCMSLSDAAAIAAPNDLGMTEIVLCIGNLQGDVKALQDSLRKRLPAYMIPARIIMFSELPLNSNGKIDRPKLRSLVASM